MPLEPVFFAGSREQDNNVFLQMVADLSHFNEFSVTTLAGRPYRVYDRRCQCQACEVFFRAGGTSEANRWHGDRSNNLTLNTIRDAYSAMISPSWDAVRLSGIGLFDTVTDATTTEVKSMLTLAHRGFRETPKYVIADRYGRTFRAKKDLGVINAVGALTAMIQDHRRHLRRGSRHYTASREPGYYYRKYVDKYTELVKEGKKPVSRKKHVAVEIEFVSDVDRDEVALLLAKSPYVAHLCIKSDNSIEADDDCSHCSNGCGCEGGDDECDGCQCSSHGHELVICAPTDIFDKVLTDALTRINSAPSNGRVNASCGLHVHLDSRFHDNELMYEALFNNQKLLYSMVPASRRDGKYSQESEYPTFRESRNNSDRYQGINPHSFDKYHTIEVRLHSGTTNANKISRWVKLLSAIGYADNNKAIETLEDLFGCGVDPLTAIYCISRMKAFKDDHESYSWLEGKDLTVFNNVLEESEAA